MFDGGKVKSECGPHALRADSQGMLLGIARASSSAKHVDKSFSGERETSV